MNNVAKQELVFEVELIIEIRAEPVLLRLPVLRHHDDGGLERGEHVEHGAEQQERISIEGSRQKHPRVQRHPEKEKSDEGGDEFPTAAELRDLVGQAIAQRELRSFQLVRVT